MAEEETAPFDMSETEAAAWRQRQHRDDLHEIARGIGQLRIDINAKFSSHTAEFAEMKTHLATLVKQGENEIARKDRAEQREADALAQVTAAKIDAVKAETNQKGEVAKIEATSRWSFREKLMATVLGIVSAAILALIGLLTKR